jgi:hypothetical protein
MLDVLFTCAAWGWSVGHSNQLPLIFSIEALSIAR